MDFNCSVVWELSRPDRASENALPRPGYWARKAIATWLSYWTGIPGGIFAPTIAVGTGFGRFLYRSVIYPWHLGSEHVLTAHEPLVAVLSATAYFAGVTHSPMTAFAVMAGLFSTTSSVVTAMLVAAVLGWRVTPSRAHPLARGDTGK